METSSSTDNPSSTPAEARAALARAQRAEQDAYQPQPLRVGPLLWASAFAGLLWVGVGLGGPWKFGAFVIVVGAVLLVGVVRRRRTGTGELSRRAMPRPIQKGMLLPIALLCVPIGLTLPLIDSALAGQPYQWLVRFAAGVALTLVLGLFSSWFYRRAYRRWLSERA